MRKHYSKTGLYYYRARYYDSSVGRFISEDPLGDGINPYVYVANLPTRFIDPFGTAKKVPDDCDELKKWIEDQARRFESKRKEYDPVEDGGGQIPRAAKYGGGFHAPGIHYANLIQLQLKLLLALIKYDNNCGGGGTPAPKCDRQLVQQKVPAPIFPITNFEIEQMIESGNRGAAGWAAVGIAGTLGLDLMTGGGAVGPTVRVFRLAFAY